MPLATGSLWLATTGLSWTASSTWMKPGSDAGRATAQVWGHMAGKVHGLKPTHAPACPLRSITDVEPRGARL